MKKKDRLIVISLVLVLVLLAIPLLLNNKTENKISQICIEENCFSVELAETLKERQTGLMNREFLAENEGMLFIFPEEGDYGFWMKNTLIPLDIIWINRDLEIVNIITAEPCQQEECPIYNPGKEALYVLEINGGLASKLKIEREEKIKIKK